MRKHRILVAYDGSREAKHALRRAARAAAKSEAAIAVVTVRSTATIPTLDKAAADAVRSLHELGFEATLYTPVGDPATEIARVARDGAYDAIYVGRRPTGSLARALLGSVSRAVAAAFRRTVVSH